MSHSELATSYAALILADDDIDITVSVRGFSCMSVALTIIQPDKLQTLIKTAKVEDVESIWTTLFAKVAAAVTSSI